MMLRADAAWLVLPPGHGCCNLASSVRILTGKQPNEIISGIVGPQLYTIVVHKPDCDEVARREAELEGRITERSIPDFEDLDICMQIHARFPGPHLASVRKGIIKAMREPMTPISSTRESEPISNTRLIWLLEERRPWAAPRRRLQARRHF